jgi:hypothetical protein
MRGREIATTMNLLRPLSFLVQGFVDIRQGLKYKNNEKVANLE